MCGSESCKVVASRMLSLINHTQDPCEDFYGFACGGLRRSSTLLEENIADDVSKRVFSKYCKVNEWILQRVILSFKKFQSVIFKHTILTTTIYFTY